MALIVVGGQSRKVGKTSVVAGLISALRECDWLAAKITQHGHDICSGNGGPCDCVLADHSAAITVERDRSGETDTSRFLVAGAKRALWVRTQQGHLAEAMPRLREEMAKARNVILESNSVLGFVQPDLYLVVLDPAKEDFKESAREHFDRADAVLMHAAEVREDWLKAPGGKPVFWVEPPTYVSEELVQFVREKATLDTRR
jgi:molybdopterin-guanine dinucleotide biosynthesis protein